MEINISIIKMAEQAGYKNQRWNTTEKFESFLEKFAALVAAHERQECAKLVEHYTGAWSDEGYSLASAIRGRT